MPINMRRYLNRNEQKNASEIYFKSRPNEWDEEREKFYCIFPIVLKRKHAINLDNDFLSRFE